MKIVINVILAHWYIVIFCFIYYYQNVILNKAKDYYKNNKKRLKEQARDKYRSLSEEEKNKKREYGKNRYHNMSEEKKQKLKKYQKNYYRTKKSQHNNE